MLQQPIKKLAQCKPRHQDPTDCRDTGASPSTTVTNPFRVQFGLSGMGVVPAGVDKSNTGHHHLLIDVNEPLDPNEPIPQDKTHLHFGAGQTEALIELPPGKHTVSS